MQTCSYHECWAASGTASMIITAATTNELHAPGSGAAKLQHHFLFTGLSSKATIWLRGDPFCYGAALITERRVIL